MALQTWFQTQVMKGKTGVAKTWSQGTWIGLVTCHGSRFLKQCYTQSFFCVIHCGFICKSVKKQWDPPTLSLSGFTDVWSPFVEFPQFSSSTPFPHNYFSFYETEYTNEPCAGQEYCSGLPCPPPGDLPNPEIEPMSLLSPALAGGCVCLFICF